jgi:DNA ligase (NAD+)
MPASGDAALTDWAALSARSARDWQSLAGGGAARANRLAAFCRHPDVQVQAARLHAAGVQGF